MTNDQPYELIIEPTSAWWRINWRDLLHYQDLLWLLVRRDFISKYKQTVLGPVWFILQPLMNTLIFTVVFKQMAGLSTDGYPGVLFYLSGMLAWQYFADCLRSTSSTFVANQNLFGKVYFPRLVVPLAVVCSNMLAYLLQLGTFLVFLLYYNTVSWAASMVSVSPWVLLTPLVLLHAAALGLGVGLWMSALTAKYRDFVHLTAFLTQLWMFGTLPLFMSAGEIPERYAWVLAANPVCAIVQWYRFAFLGSAAPDLLQYGVSVAVTLVVLVSGVLTFSRTEKTFIDTV